MLNKFLSHLRRLREGMRSAGIRVTLEWYCLRIAQKLGMNTDGTWRVRPRRAAHPLSVRLGSTSDLMVFEQIFIQNEYGCLQVLNDVSVIIDLGGNVGFSSAWLLSCFPRARVLAVEPDAGNVRILQENLSPYGPRAEVRHGAAWSECSVLRMSEGALGDGNEWGRQVERAGPSESGSIPAWDVATLIGMTGSEVVDLLKIDIERGELAVFSGSAQAWLPRVRNICIELHGRDCEEAFFSALAGFDYDLSHSGELTICLNLRPSQGESGDNNL